MAADCRIVGCDKPAQAKQLCWAHYGRLRRNGDPLATGKHGGHNKGQARAAAENVPDPQPLRTLSGALRQEQAWSTDFRLAWPRCVALALRGLPDDVANEWREVLAETEPQWRSAYDRDGPPRSISALGMHVGAEPWHLHRRTGPPIVTTGQRHDGDCELEPVVISWCN
jgi:hypothetical protein